MKSFSEVLAGLPAVSHLAALELYLGEEDTPCACIENRPGQAGSLAVYHQLQLQFGAIDAQAAQVGLALYAEHAADARAYPGKHPNIDRLLALIGSDERYRVELIPVA